MSTTTLTIRVPVLSADEALLLANICNQLRDAIWASYGPWMAQRLAADDVHSGHIEDTEDDFGHDIPF